MSLKLPNTEQILKTMKTYIPLLIGSSILCLFSAYIIDIWKNSFLYTIFASVRSGSWAIDVLILFYILFYILYFVRTYHKALCHPCKIYAYTIAIAVVYTFYKYIVCIDWQYVSFSFSKIKYLDSFYIPLITSVIIYIIIRCNRYFNLKKQPVTTERDQTNEPIGFIDDMPGEVDDEDLYNRKPFAEILARNLLKPNLPETSQNSNDKKNTNEAFALGIVGEWGAGKTRFLKMIKSNLTPEAVCMDFRPWLCKDENDLTNEYFTLLKNEIAVYNPEIVSPLDNYIKTLLDVTENSFFSGLKSFLFSEKSDSILSYYNQVKEALEKTHKTFVICIDDLDRLNAGEICSVLRIIRNTSNFPNLKFIVTYDKNYIIETLKDELCTPAEYLNKIFNAEVYLPSFDNEILIKELIKRIIALPISQKQIIEEYFESDHNKCELFAMALKNMRGVKRFENSVRQALSALMLEVKDGGFDIISLLWLELLKHHSIQLYITLRDYPDTLLETEENSSYYSIRKNIFQPIKKQREKSNLEQITRSLGKNTKSEKEMEPEYCSVSQITQKNEQHFDELSFSILEQLIKNDDHRRAHISSILHFHHYFSYGTQTSYIPYQEFVEAIRGDKTIEILDGWIKETKQKTIWYNLTQFQYKNELTIKEKLKVICCYLEAYSRNFGVYRIKDDADYLVKNLFGFMTSSAEFWTGENNNPEAFEFFRLPEMSLVKIYILISTLPSVQEESSRKEICSIITRHINTYLKEHPEENAISDTTVMICYAMRLLQEYLKTKMQIGKWQKRIKKMILDNRQPWLIKSLYRTKGEPTEIMLDRYFLTVIFGTKGDFINFLKEMPQRKNDIFLRNYRNFVNTTFEDKNNKDTYYSVQSFPDLETDKIEIKYDFPPFPKDISFSTIDEKQRYEAKHHH